jgi:HAMP domain-containing protein
MVFSSEQNDFFAKRFVYASNKKTPNGSGSEAVSASTPEMKKPAEAPGSSVVDESRQKISDLLDDRTKVDKLIGVQEGQVLSPKEMLANMKKVVREDQSSDDWVRQTYEKFYPKELASGVTKEARRVIAKKEFERFRDYLDEDANKRVAALIDPSKKPVYSDAMDAIRNGVYTANGNTINIGDVDKGTKAVIENLKLKATHTVAYHQKAAELKKINEEIEAKKTQLIPFDQEIKDHDENRNKISKAREWFNKQDWLKPSWLLKKTAKVGLIGLAATSALGLGAGILGYGILPTSGILGWLAGSGASGSLAAGINTSLIVGAESFKLLGSGIGLLAAKAGMTVPALAATTAVGIGAYSLLSGPLIDWAKGPIHDIGKWRLEKKKESKKAEIGLDKLEEDKKEAESLIEKYQEDHKAKVEVLNNERKKYVAEQSRLNGLIEQASSKGNETNLSELQAELEKVTAYLLNIDGLLSVLKSTEKGNIDGVSNIDDISRNIQAMDLDATTSKQLLEIANEKEKEWLGTQKELMDTRFRDGILKDKDKIEPELLKAVTDFLQGTADDKMQTDMFNKLRIEAPDLHRLVRTLQNLPKQSVLQKDIREILGPIFKEAQKTLDVKDEVGAVTKAFNRLPENLKEYVQNRTQALYDAWDNYKPGETNPFPAPNTNQNFEKWIKNFSAVQLNKMLDFLEHLRTNVVIEENKIIDKLTPIVSKIREYFETLSPELRDYLNQEKEKGLQKISEKIGSPQSFSLSTGADFMKVIENTKDINELEKIRSIMPKVRDSIEIDEGPPPSPERGDEMANKINESFNKLYEVTAERDMRATADSIERSPNLLKTVMPLGRELPIATTGIPFKDYIKGLSYKQKKIALDILRLVARDEYVVVGTDLMKQVDRQIKSIKEVITNIEEKMKAVIGSGSHKFTIKMYRECPSGWDGTTRFDSVSISGGVSESDKLSDVLANVDRRKLHQLLDYLETVRDKSYYSRKQNKFISEESVKAEIKKIWNGESGRQTIKPQVKSIILTDLDCFHILSGGQLPVKGTHGSFESYERSIADMNQKEELRDILSSIQNIDAPTFTKMLSDARPPIVDVPRSESVPESTTTSHHAGLIENADKLRKDAENDLGNKA